uniref:Uncharacterized protein LOC114331939 n=1 Tax=Diabrotica virgifera virgifera TaxID=50390 RepID=A0A6P7FME6_DIAVI
MCNNKYINNINNLDTNDYFAFFYEPDIRIPTYYNSSLLDLCILNSCIDKWPKATVIYTDASKTSEGTGCAFYIPSKSTEKMFKLPSNCSIFSAEAIAILESLIYFDSLNNNSVLIISDSLSVLLCLKNSKLPNYNSNPFIYQIKNMLVKLKNKNKTTNFIWVKAHVGIKYNEHVDSLAKAI